MPGARWATALSVGLATPLLLLLILVQLDYEPPSDGTPEGRAVMSVNVMIGAVLILLMTMLLSAFALEATACSVGVPNCD